MSFIYQNITPLNYKSNNSIKEIYLLSIPKMKELILEVDKDPIDQYAKQLD
ncbi:hypothetical protein N3Z17_02385 [Candidatus Bandiella numerosa]|jgi:hypothetical protein|uniref:hypothetical protein n=1 Tax=Candidatus Bandiella numerosa TaxID=2570586 RepID=UPI00249F0F81|nr:hypothetical protein [Candidatus Bandiella numerosa]WHA05377.1 hypothetical protein N3Z17_02385 [Candidatus Bandiella numerosa]